MRDGFIKVAAGTPKIKVADCRHNAEQIFTLMREASRQGVRVLVLPELCLTGATCGDLFLQPTLLKGAEEGLATILEATRHLDMVTALGRSSSSLTRVLKGLSSALSASFSSRFSSIVLRANTVVICAVPISTISRSVG